MQVVSIAIAFYFVITEVSARNIFSQSIFSFTVKPTLSISIPVSGTNSLVSGVAIGGASYGGFIGYNLNQHIKIMSGIESKIKSLQYNYSYNLEGSTFSDISTDEVHQIGIPVLAAYYLDSTNRHFFLIGGVSFDFFISGTRSLGREYLFADLVGYSKTEFTVEIGGGYDFTLGNRTRLEFSLTYSYPVKNPYPEASMSSKISSLRFGVGFTYLL